MTVDGTHCHIFELRQDPSSKWYSHKFNKRGLVYEIRLAVHKNQIVWINEPFPAGDSDLVVFQKPGGLKEQIPDGK